MVDMRWELAPYTEPWTGPARRRASQFRAGWDDTLRRLSDETGRLDAGLVVIEIDIAEGRLTRNRQSIAQGWAPAGSGVRVRFESKHGEQNYATGEFWNWRDNVRAVALSLEALRAVDRFGVSHGQQYVGFRPAITAGDAVEFANPKDAITWLAATAKDLKVEAGAPGDLYRRLSRLVHPDDAGHADRDPDGMIWLRLQAAKTQLSKAGVM